jgi:hypothetical protein
MTNRLKVAIAAGLALLGIAFVGLQAPARACDVSSAIDTIVSVRQPAGSPTQSVPIGSSYLCSTVLIDATNGPVNLVLAAPPSAGQGLIAFKKIDLTSNLVALVPATLVPATSSTPASGTFEDGMISIPLSLEGDAATMESDGNANWWLLSPGLATLRHNPFVAEHTIISTGYQMQPSYNGYIMLVDTSVNNAPIMIALPPISAAQALAMDMPRAAFSHQTFTALVTKFDSTSNVVSVVSEPGEVIEGGTQLSSGSYLINLTAFHETYLFWSDGARWIALPFAPMTQ